MVDGDVLRAGLERPGVPVFSPDGTRWAAAGSLRAEADQADPGPTVVWVDGREAGRWRAITRPGFTADATHVAWLALEGQVAYGCRLAGDPASPLTIVVVDGRRLGPHQSVYGVAVSDGGVAAYAASDDAPAASPGRWRYHVDGRPVGESFLEAWRPRLDPTGRRLAWEATPKSESYLGLDATRISRFDQVFWGPEFVEPREVAWVVRRGRKLARVSVRF